MLSYFAGLYYPHFFFWYYASANLFLFDMMSPFMVHKTDTLTTLHRIFRLPIGQALPANWLLRYPNIPCRDLTLAPLLDILNKEIKQEVRVRWAAGGLGMELR